MYDIVSHLLIPFSESCPSGYQKYREVCYIVFLTLKTFSESAKTCRASGGTLAMPRDAGINDFLITLIKNSKNGARGADFKGSVFPFIRPADFWFGLHDQNREGHWEWIDDTELGTGYRAWAEGEPNNQDGIQDCASYWAARNFQWDDDHCYYKMKFICQVKPPDAGGTSA
ncbi:perlucin-like protein [Branchiostoma lanceolatum]|uniref:perlucin-like protein n=1 Tax=Branchiostoma lanceolatum TaxID=7740 RepID=UPI0034528DC9